MTAAEALTAAAGRLREAGVPDPARDARRLLAHALDVPADRLTLVLRESVPDEARRAFERAVTRRAAREPVSHILGVREFYGRRFRVTPDVLDPRPETETLVERALQQRFRTVLDLGTGSGCILLTLLAERPGARGLGTDVSAAALDVARHSADHLGVSPRASWALSDWFAAVEGRFDLIVANPPYIAEDEMADLAPELRHEPRSALTPGGDGLDGYRRIARGALRHLAPGGRLLVEIGQGQRAAVADLFSAAGLASVACFSDLDGRDRVIEAAAPCAETGEIALSESFRLLPQRVRD